MSYKDAQEYNGHWEKITREEISHPEMTSEDYSRWTLGNDKLTEIKAINKIDADKLIKLRVENKNRVLPEAGGTAGGKTSYGKSSGKIGDFTELEGSTVDEILDRIPDEAVLRELYPVQGGATEGFEFKWVQNGQTYRVRVHNVDPSAPVGSNAYNGWVVRVQRGRRYFDPTINDFREAKYFNPNGPDYDEVIINDTHIPILDPYQN